jgi:ATPase family associated with various cellular activities (AAA)
MARSDLIIKLVRAGASGDIAALRSTAEALAADERAKRHSGFADRITKALETAAKSGAPIRRGLPATRSIEGSSGIQRREPHRPLEDLYLAGSVRGLCGELIEEQRRADVLRAHGIEPRHRVLLVGPPGNGKTSLAESIAYELSLPLFTVRYDAVITSYLGETAQRLRRLFDFVRTEPCVLFFDEFDAIGKERGDLHETGEIKRVVTTLLLQLDDLPSYCVLIGATNHPELLDRATWRRFQLRLDLGRPNEDDMEAYCSDQLRRLSLQAGSPGYTGKRLAQAIRPGSYAEAEDFFLDVRRRAVLALGGISFRAVLDDRVRAWSERTPAEALEHADRSSDSAAA